MKFNLNFYYEIELKVEISDVILEDEIGRGCFAVYKGRWKDQVVAIKKIPIPVGVSNEEMLKGNNEIAALRYILIY